LVPHILLGESGLEYEAVAIDLKAKRLPDGSDYKAVNPKGAVPALSLDGGEVLTENATILQYIADQAGPTTLLPAEGLARYRVLEWVTYMEAAMRLNNLRWPEKSFPSVNCRPRFFSNLWSSEHAIDQIFGCNRASRCLGG